ncbi:hypothetical protein [Halodesulfovibrio marinisediminis]|uniref:Uncharacterized protein n=1 Tax=Halodesulfovibrio marinisediminis DSM 17456 TaxID=1121457 RepID=A0A1N6J487_9BACT|nr:hypothetical protein [Halodesulfovibrio marinisediminis]SIO39097.1 hypothetical protein SAMN02745161_3141 [Halodesulfovibrio marinisediminis DSM 17456]
MATYDCEVLGYVQYNSELSYAELIECEDELKEKLTETLHACGAEHLDFFALDDGLRIQFVLTDYDEGLLHTICDAVVPFFPTQTVARLYAIQKNLEMSSLYQFTNGAWKESGIDISSGTCV